MNTLPDYLQEVLQYYEPTLDGKPARILPFAHNQVRIMNEERMVLGDVGFVLEVLKLHNGRFYSQF